MTNLEMNRIKDEINKKYYGDKPHTPENLKMPISDDDNRRLEELECIDMINSCLTYGDDPFQMHYQWWYGFGYCTRSYMSEYEDALGTERVKELVDEQKKEFANATISKGVYTDNEGVSYNSVKFSDEI